MRNNLLLFTFVWLAIRCHGAPEPERPAIGAIRWDAWVGDASPVGLAVEKTLSPAPWHYRLPFYAEELSSAKVRVRGNSQSTMDREIQYAASAGLNYWAFVIYPPDDPMTKGGIDLYLSSPHKEAIHFCALIEGNHLGAAAHDWLPCEDRLVKYFLNPGYQKVRGNRPLIYILQAGEMVSPNGFATPAAARSAIDGLRKAAAADGGGAPFIVAMEWSAQAGKTAMDQLGLDAVSSYASNGGAKGAPYSDLVSYTENSWDTYAASVPQIIPWVTTGWDRRPRLQTSVFWESQYGQGVYYEKFQATEFTRHVHDALKWNANHPEHASANAIIIYAWNEFDEGGWLCPTLSEGEARLKALSSALSK